MPIHHIPAQPHTSCFCVHFFLPPCNDVRFMNACMWFMAQSSVSVHMADDHNQIIMLWARHSSVLNMAGRLQPVMCRQGGPGA